MTLTNDLAYLDQKGWHIELFQFLNVEIGCTFKKTFDGTTVQLSCTPPDESEWAKLMKIVGFAEEIYGAQGTNSS